MADDLRSVGSTRRPTRGIRNNNPLNIRINKQNLWRGRVIPNTDGVFEQFISMRYGIRAAAILLSEYYYGRKLNTITKIIRRWAPPIENDTDAYIRNVMKLTGFAGKEVLQPEALTSVLYAMAQVESGKEVATYRNDFIEIGRIAFDQCEIPGDV